MTTFKPSGLSSAVYMNGWNMWHYRYDGDGAPPTAHFSPAANMIRLGDQIAFTSPTHAGTLIVTHVEPGVVFAHIAFVAALES